MSWLDCDDGWVRLFLHRGLALIYGLAFASALHQFRALLGSRGLLPIAKFLEGRHFAQYPSLFFLYYSDRFYEVVAGLGLALSCLALLGVVDGGPLWMSLGGWLLLWVLYQSLVQVGQRFYGFGWESMLLEAGFLAAFLGPDGTQPSWIPLWSLRWMLFRLELGAGLIKLRHDRCWRDLTCLCYHYETQPLPNPWSWHFHHLPSFFHRAAVLGSHLVQVVIPFALFLPQPFSSLAAAAIVFHQFWLIVSGNYSWLNWLTVVLGWSACSDAWLGWTSGPWLPRPWLWDGVLLVFAVGIVGLSRAPLLNLFSPKQAMNLSYNVLRLVNSYGAFGSVTRERYEIVLEGTWEPFPTRGTEWKEYEFWAKPGDPRRRPAQLAPYHLRLDWMMWFLPLSLAGLSPDGPPERRVAWRYERWFLTLVERLLEGDAATLALLRHNPFAVGPPLFVRAVVYHYRFSTPEERRDSGQWWQRRRVGIYLPAQGRPV